jgi:uncharacterized delta-60 repeat protein
MFRAPDSGTTELPLPPRRARGNVSTGPALLAVIVASLILVSGAQAAAGDLDLTFSGDGKQTTAFGTDASYASAVVRQVNGKVVAVGQAGDDFALARYNLDGSLDANFSGDGRQRTNFGGFDGANDVVLQGNGRIVAVGFSIDNANTSHFALARYNPNGSLDTTFSWNGKRMMDFGNDFDHAKGVTLQDDGKIVVVGETCCLDSFDAFAIARLNRNGSLDTTFSGDGKRTTDFGEYQDAAHGVAVQANGKIVVVGFAELFGFGLARYNPNGSPDTTFSGNGKQTTVFGGCCPADAADVVIQANGKLVAAGTSGSFASFGSDGDFALARYNANGSLDMTFSGDGKQTTDFFFGAEDQAEDLAIQANGRIVTVGVARGGATGGDFALARYKADGTLDTSFSGDGRRRTNFGDFDGADGVALQGDGKIIAAGFGNGDFALARYLGG